MPLFTRPQTTAIIFDALRYRQEHAGWRIYGYVILENHLHLVVQAEDLSAELPRFKSYTARKLIDCLREHRAERLLQQLAFFRKAPKQDRDFQLWEEASHPELIENEMVLGGSWNTFIRIRRSGAMWMTRSIGAIPAPEITPACRG